MNKKRNANLVKLFKKLLTTTRNTICAAEVGVWKGKLSVHLLREFPNMHLFCIDLWEDCGGHAFKDYDKQYMEDIHRRFKKATKDYTDRITEIQLPSIEAYKTIRPESLSLVFVDALHDFKSVSEDIEAWESRVKPGGIVSGHDYYGKWDKTSEVKKAVDEHAKKHGVEIKTKRSLDTWWFRKQ